MCVCACETDLLNRPRFQFHASEFDSRTREGEREIKRRKSPASNVPPGHRDREMEGGRDGGRGGEMEGGRDGEMEEIGRAHV